ncbi:PAS domain S-box protein [Oceanibacterium hippocampi]|uniref:histidine kinase n=1 Tax=Oceanibacterium hippocampi TaxID=745714 RepID=A0A1Y5SD87_9PROT|nr:PAS domain S-box protein [Oceanibacterium hippocampi]SLN38056.1 Blue-light-activated protein [Oceanibacterium hippocampi]
MEISGGDSVRSAEYAIGTSIFEHVDPASPLGRDIARGQGGDNFVSSHDLPEGELSFTFRPLRDSPQGDRICRITAIPGPLEIALQTRLGEVEDRYYHLVEAAPDAIVVVRGEVIAHCNRAMADLVGYPQGELIGMVVTDLIVPEDRAHILALRARRLGGENPPQQYSFRALTRSGLRRDIEATAGLVQWDGVPAIQVVARDVTTQRRAARNLRHAQRMEAVGRLTGGVAHDFNNLLAIVLGNLEIVLDEVGDSDILIKRLETAIRATERGSTLTHSLLAFARRQPLDPAPADVNLALVGMSTLLRRTLGARIRLEIRSPETLWPTLVDLSQLENTLLNLAINARDAMPDGGTVIVETANVVDGQEVEGEQAVIAPASFVRLTMRDDGLGMEKQVREQAIEPFFTTKEIGQGSGLGLSMAYGFMKQSGGYLTIDSAPGKGSDISLYLPRADRQGDDAGVADRIPRGTGERILLIDDEDDVRDYVAAQLSGLGYEVISAGSAREASSLIGEQGRFDLLLTDVVVPGELSGDALARHFRHRDNRLVVLFMSGHDPGVIGIAPEQLLRKPFRHWELAARVRAALDARP